MRPQLKPGIGRYVLVSALAGKPELYEKLRDVVSNVRKGLSIVWLFDDETVMVTTTTYDSKGVGTLFIDFVIAEVRGALKRHMPTVIEFCRMFQHKKIACKPLGPSQRRLYERMEFVSLLSKMEYTV